MDCRDSGCRTVQVGSSKPGIATTIASETIVGAFKACNLPAYNALEAILLFTVNWEFRQVAALIEQADISAASHAAL